MLVTVVVNVNSKEIKKIVLTKEEICIVSNVMLLSHDVLSN